MRGASTSVSGSTRVCVDSVGGGRYEIDEEFASGGVASVHLARYTTPGGVTKICAVKKLHPQFAKDAVFRSALLDEARLVSRIEHPNVARILDVCDEPDDLFLAMEYVDGVALSRLLAATEHAPVEPSIACAIAAGALEGLHAAHEAKAANGEPLALVHRDVSPQNVLVGADGIPRVIDFGMAYALGRSHATQSGVVKGKPSYMSPEQVRGERVTRASDVFSMGVMLWEALTGRRLFVGDVVAATLFKVLAEPIPRPRSVVPSIPEALERAVMKALERAPADRHPTARAFARALVDAVPPATPDAISAWMARAGAEFLDDMRRRIAAFGVESFPVGAVEGEPLAGRASAAVEGDALLRPAPSVARAQDVGRSRALGWIVGATAAASIIWIAGVELGRRDDPQASPATPSVTRATPEAQARPTSASAAPASPPSRILPAPSTGAVPAPVSDDVPAAAPASASAPPASARPPTSVAPPAVSVAPSGRGELRPRKLACTDPFNPKCN